MRTGSEPARQLGQKAEHLDTHICVVTADHLSIGNLQQTDPVRPEQNQSRTRTCGPPAYLVADAVARLIGVVGPVHLAVGVSFRQNRGLLGKLLGQR